jgi:hypothetical protein
MFDKLCNWMNAQGTLVAVATVVGGLHLMLSANQPVLGMLDLPVLTFMGKDIGVQWVLGTFLTVAGLCAIRK